MRCKHETNKGLAFLSSILLSDCNEFLKKHGRIYHSFAFSLHVTSQLVPQMKEKIPQHSEIPRWDSIGILAVQSSGLLLFKLAKLHRITECFMLEEEFIWSSPPAESRVNFSVRSGCLGICPVEVWIPQRMEIPQPVGDLVSEHPHGESFLLDTPPEFPSLGSIQPCTTSRSPSSRVVKLLSTAPGFSL